MSTYADTGTRALSRHGIVGFPKAAATAAPPVANAVPEGRGARREEEEVLWPVKGLRVRVVDEDRVGVRLVQ